MPLYLPTVLLLWHYAPNHFESDTSVWYSVISHVKHLGLKLKLALILFLFRCWLSNQFKLVIRSYFSSKKFYFPNNLIEKYYTRPCYIATASHLNQTKKFFWKLIFMVSSKSMKVYFKLDLTLIVIIIDLIWCG